jgi:hypothetical protein
MTAPGITPVLRVTGILLAGASVLPAAERQLTHAPHGHVLTNVNVWSPDSRWIVYDVRSVDSVFDGTRIEQVNVETGEVQVLYEARDGAACGVVTYHPREPKVVFIHGPERPSPDWSYGASRRRGVIVDTRRPGEARPLDAMTYAPPFVPGALRGGSHVHVFGPDGAWVSYTYEDEVLARLGPASDGGHDANQRNVGVSVPAPPRGVQVPPTHPRNHDGDAFSVLVTRTVNRPRPGSDEISKAYEDGWIGRRALAFLGNVTTLDGREHAEVFAVDLPEDLTRPGDGPLQGTDVRRPAPPRGVTQRRLTYTAESRFPGVVTAPRHWVRASPDGTQLAFLMKDDGGVVQLWTVSPRGEALRQVTNGPAGIDSAFTWSPDGRRIAHTMGGAVCTTDIATGRTTRLTGDRDDAGSPEPLACVFSPAGRHVAFLRRVSTVGGSFAQVFVVSAPSP